MSSRLEGLVGYPGVSGATAVEGWAAMQQIAHWLEKLGMSEYALALSRQRNRCLGASLSN